jgi:hypothetical protein
MSALNPNHPTTRAMEHQWHAVLAIVMHKLGVTELAISDADVLSLVPGTGVAVQDGKNGDGLLHVWLVSPEEAKRLALEQGGLPS